MKFISTSGEVLIQAGGRNVSRRIRDVWPDHAIQFYENTNWENASGLFINATRFKLKSLTNFVYLHCQPGTLEIADGFFFVFRMYEDAPGWNGGFGEAFNQFLHDHVVDKWTEAQLAAWELT